MKDLIVSLESRENKFSEYNDACPNKLDFEQECLFARQALMGNDWLTKVAMGNQQSLIDAIYNVATTGISLNPAHAHGYLVPRKVAGVQKICLDISYRGFLKMATDSGVIKYMKAELVYEKDNYQYKGFDERPVFETNPFGSRGKLIGVYAMAVMHDDSVLVENMDADTVYKIRDSSEAYKKALQHKNPDNNEHWKYKNCVWVKFEDEMVKKTVLKRAFKTLPQSKGKELLEQAAYIVNEHEGIEFDKQETKEVEIEFTSKESEAYRKALADADYTGLISLIDGLSNEAQSQLFDIHEKPLMPQGGKGRYAEQMKQHINNAREMREGNLAELIAACDSADDVLVTEILGECNHWEVEWYMQKLNNEREQYARQFIFDQKDEAA